MSTPWKILAILTTAASMVACAAEAPQEEPVADSSQDLDVCKDIILPIMAPGVKVANDCAAGESCAPSGFEAVASRNSSQKVSVYRGGHPKDDGMMDFLAEKHIARIVTLEMPATTLQGKVESFCQHDGIPDESKRAKDRKIAFSALGFDPTKEEVDLEASGGGIGKGCKDTTSLNDPSSACHQVMDKQVEAALDFMKDATPDAPVFLHCTLGVDRTGLLIALHRIRNEGWSALDAAKEWMSHSYGGGGWTKPTRCQQFPTIDLTFNRWVKKLHPTESFQLDASKPRCGVPTE